MIVFACVAGPSRAVLAEATCSSAPAGSGVQQAAPVARKIIAKIGGHNHKMSYQQDTYTFDYRVLDGIVYLAMSDADTSRNLAFAFLEDIKNRFAPLAARAAATGELGLNNEFKAVLLQRLDTAAQAQSSSSTSIAKVQEQVEDVKGVMMSNIDSVLERGEKIDRLVDKSEELQHQASTFQRGSRTLRQKMFWRNVKLAVVIFILVSLFITFAIVMPACGGPSFPKCQSGGGGGGGGGDDDGMDDGMGDGDMGGGGA